MATIVYETAAWGELHSKVLHFLADHVPEDGSYERWMFLGFGFDELVEKKRERIGPFLQVFRDVGFDFPTYRIGKHEKTSIWDYYTIQNDPDRIVIVMVFKNDADAITFKLMMS
jgi:hypothetical protein